MCLVASRADAPCGPARPADDNDGDLDIFEAVGPGIAPTDVIAPKNAELHMNVGNGRYIRPSGSSALSALTMGRAISCAAFGDFVRAADARSNLLVHLAPAHPPHIRATSLGMRAGQ